MGETRDALVAAAKKSAVDTMEMFLRNFSKVPDDKLTWTPAPTAKSALKIAAHTSLYAARFAYMIKERQLPMPENLEAWLAQREEEENAITTREQVISAFREGTELVLEALDSLHDQDIDGELDSGQGWTMSMRFVMTLPGFHAALHMGQIDFLQTCWGDQEIYVG